MSDSGGEITQLLTRARNGDEAAREALLVCVYEQLVATAGARIRAERPGHSMHASDLLNQAMVRIMASDVPTLAVDRRYLFGAAHRAMRQILVDHSRKQRVAQLTRTDPEARGDWNARFEQEYGFSVEEIEAAIAQLEKDSPRQAEVVMCRFFSGMTIADTAEMLEVSTGTVERDWRLARAKLRRDLRRMNTLIDTEPAEPAGPDGSMGTS